MRLLLASLACAALASPARAQVPFPEETDFHNTTYVGDEPEPARLALFRAQEHLVGERFKEAGREVLKLLRGPTRGRVRFDDRLVVPVETAALLFLLELPAEVRAELAAEEAALDRAPPADRDLAALRAYAARHPLSAQGELAWLHAGTLALLDGDPASAAADLERLVQWPSAAPASNDGRGRALAAARLVQALARLDEPPFAGSLARWPEPGAVIEREAEPTTFAELLKSARSDPRSVGRDATTLLVDDARAARPAFPDRRPRPQFVLRQRMADDAPLEREYALQFATHRRRFQLPKELASIPGRPDAELELKDLPSCAPLVVGERMITLERESAEAGAPVALHVRSLADGRDLFAPIRSDFDLHLDPRGAMVVVERAGLAARGGKLYVTFELRDGLQPLRELFRSTEASSSSTALFGLDLDREGFVDFGVTSEQLAADPLLAGYVFAGPPVESGGRILVAASRLVNKETECALLAFDARSGAIAGSCLLARASAVPRVGDRFIEDETRRVNPSPVALRDGTAYVCTNLGVIAAVRASDLELEWAFRYHRIDPPESDRFDRAAYYDLGPWIGRAPIALADRVLATPADSLYLYSLARWPDRDGHLLLNDPIEKQSRMCWLGADEKECWFLKRVGVPGGSSYLVEATDHDGAYHWQTPPLGGVVTGVPALSDRFLFVPTDRCIYRLDLQRDALLDVIPPPGEVGIPYPEFGTFGDLAVCDRLLVSTSELFTIAFAPAPE